MITHKELIEKGVNYLIQKSYYVVITELSTLNLSGEIPDIIGFDFEKSIVIECKVSLQDWKRDREKKFRKNPALGLGNYRYYLIPDTLLYKTKMMNEEKKKSLLGNWGLLSYITLNPWNKKEELKQGRIINIHTSPYFSRNPYMFLNERRILISAFRRIQGKGIKIKGLNTSSRKATITIKEIHIDNPNTVITKKKSKKKKGKQ